MMNKVCFFGFFFGFFFVVFFVYLQIVQCSSKQMLKMRGRDWVELEAVENDYFRSFLFSLRESNLNDQNGIPLSFYTPSTGQQYCAILQTANQKQERKQRNQSESEPEVSENISQ